MLLASWAPDGWDAAGAFRALVCRARVRRCRAGVPVPPGGAPPPPFVAWSDQFTDAWSDLLLARSRSPNKFDRSAR